ncbi:DUF5337 domain-containing protein [Amylibacter sp.]|nr:DUF5337 domain-containing protein [Rhodobacterales bacterium]MCO4796014.1 DUF5337 domain-containing protein [Amylibacter sp.]MBT4470861.1 DUF5337 domain-containing protein [Rhodobacterales bacterium]MBT6833263.1 DUF5337 domain-containing protein [Rhodobacterales bacterium]MBT6894620.1 DUF5337 domain-containing protein [Rhodobacterales bacterium]
MKLVDTKSRSQTRLASVVILITMVIWMALQWAGGLIGLEARYVFLLDFFALAAFAWSLMVLIRVWLRRQ